MRNLKILQREIPECNFIYEVVHSGLEFREEVRAEPKYCILHKSLINFILLNVRAEDIRRMCGEDGRNVSCEKLSAERAKGFSENILWCLTYLLILSGI